VCVSVCRCVYGVLVCVFGASVCGCVYGVLVCVGCTGVCVGVQVYVWVLFSCCDRGRWASAPEVKL